MDLTDRAVEMASRAHKNQVRKGANTPYVTHPLSVGIMLARAGCSDEVIAAGILHDTVEETGISLEDIRKGFEEKVAGIVEGASERTRRSLRPFHILHSPDGICHGHRRGGF